MALQANTIVNRPIEDIFKCMTNTALIQQMITPSWLWNNAPPPEIRQITEGAMGVGTKFVQSEEAGNHLVETTIEVLEYQRPLVFAFEVAGRRGITRIKWVLQAASEGTMVTLVFGPKRLLLLFRDIFVLHLIMGIDERFVEYAGIEGTYASRPARCFYKYQA